MVQIPCLSIICECLWLLGGCNKKRTHNTFLQRGEEADATNDKLIIFSALERFSQASLASFCDVVVAAGRLFVAAGRHFAAAVAEPRPSRHRLAKQLVGRACRWRVPARRVKFLRVGGTFAAYRICFWWQEPARGSCPDRADPPEDPLPIQHQERYLGEQHLGCDEGGRQ